MKRKLIGVGAALGVVAAVALGITWYRDRPLPEAPPHARVAPALDALPKLKVCWAEFLKEDFPGAYVSAGFHRASQWRLTTSGIVVHHPQGTVVIDTGNSSHLKEEVADYPLLPGLFMKLGPGAQHRVAFAPDALRAVGADPAKLKWVVLSHMHVDHAGGLVDLPGAPVLLPQEEIDFAREYGKQKTIAVVPAHAATIEGRTTAMTFQPKPYETFDEQADIFGDGSVVAVKLAGHTPGSIGVFVNVSKTQRLFHVGDVLNATEAYERRVGKSVFMMATDLDGARADAQVSRLAQFHAAAPEVQIIPAHDRPAWERFFGTPGRCVGGE